MEGERGEEIDKFNSMSEKIKILAGQLSAVFNLDGRHHHRYLSAQEPITESFVENLILHDEVIIPLQDYSAPIALVKILGEKPFIELLESEKLTFARMRGVLGFGRGSGEDGGILIVNAEPRNSVASSADLDIAIESGIREFYSGCVERDKIRKLLAEKTLELDTQGELSKIIKESNMDLKQSTLWRSSFEYDDQNGLFALPGIEKMGVRTFGPGFKPSSIIIDYYLLSVLSNLELSLADSLGCVSVSTNQASGLILRRKIERLVKSRTDLESYYKVKTIADIPDIGKIIFSEPVKMEKLVKLLTSRDAQLFRQWMQANSGKSDLEISKAYIDLLKTSSLVEGMPAKVMRFLVTTFSTSNPFFAPLLSFADAFLVDKLLRGRSPKYFIDKLSKFKGITK